MIEIALAIGGIAFALGEFYVWHQRHSLARRAKTRSAQLPSSLSTTEAPAMASLNDAGSRRLRRRHEEVIAHRMSLRGPPILGEPAGLARKGPSAARWPNLACRR